MVELTKRGLRFSFPDVHEHAVLEVDFHRTLRIPDDGEIHYLPPSLGSFPLRHVDDFASHVPAAWSTHGGVMLPMYQAEAMWISFHADGVPHRAAAYPFAVKIAAGKIDAVSGAAWSNDLHASPQDYLVVPDQPWLDGFVVGDGVIRQFVAMPLGAGYTAEEQVTGVAEHGGMQILVRPMRRDVFMRRFRYRPSIDLRGAVTSGLALMSSAIPMGLAPGGRMKQQVFKDKFKIDDWHATETRRCFVHLTDALTWHAITGEQPPGVPPTAREYTERGLPWFDHYADQPTVAGSETLERLRSVLALAAAKGERVLPENESVAVDRVVRLGDRSATRRELPTSGV